MKHIVFVDDDRVLTKLLSTYLESYDLKISSFNCGHKALSFIEVDKKPDLIISDMNMPQMSGHEFLQKLDKDTSTKSIPVLVFSGSEDTETKATFPQIKAFVKKPCPPEKLLQIIEQHIA
ncbi:response regulator [bacterium]|nr:response regulator [bacterium]